MKGPGLRTKLDVRRLWRCPETGRFLKAGGHVTQLASPFSRRPCFMEMVENQEKPRLQLDLEEILSHMQIPVEPAQASRETPAKDQPENPA